MIIDEKVRDEKLKRESAKISALSSYKIANIY